MLNATPLLPRFLAGSHSACAELFTRVRPGQIRHARRVIGPGIPGVCDPEDLAQLVFVRLWQEVQSGKGIRDRLTDTPSLLGALGLLTRQCAGTMRRDMLRPKRDATRTVHWDDGTGAEVPARGADPVPTEWPAHWTERQQRVATLRSEGWLLGEIAERVECSLRTVERELRWIGEDLARGSAGFAST